MAVGDIVNVNMNGVTSYQPASGVEIMVLKNFSTSIALSYGFQDSVRTTNQHMNATGHPSWYDGSSIGIKFGITNTQYYYNSSATASSGFSGIQIK